MSDHLVPLGRTGWSVWRDAVLRSAGFPFDGLVRFAAQECAKAADAFLDGEHDRFEELFERALADGAATCRELAGDPRFREAVTWQNPNALTALNGLRSRETRRNSKWRLRERLVAAYWQRYCAKNETIGFFGPTAWITVDPRASAITFQHGRDVVRDRAVDFEYWALAAFSGEMAADPQVRAWLPASLPPHLTFDAAGRRVFRPALAPLSVSAVEAAALARCDGRGPANAVVAELVATGMVRTESDGFLVLERLAERELLNWNGELPIGLHAERALHGLIAGIGDPAVRDRVSGRFARLASARDDVAGSAGDPDRLGEALGRLADEFTAVTGSLPTRRAGQAYAGRGLCFEETSRDVDMVVGGRLLTDLAEPLALVLRAARWFTAELAHTYSVALREVYDDLSGGEVRLADMWYLAQGLLFGTGERPVDGVTREFGARWAKLFGLDGGMPGRFTSAELAETAVAVFPAERPGWSAGRLHSPDLMICADSADAVERGDYLAVLGEMHTAWPALDGAFLTRWHPRPDTLIRALAEDIGDRRIRPLYPADWPRYSGRLSHTLDGPSDRQLGFAAAPGADPDRLLPTTSVVVREHAGELVAVAPDGQSWPLLEMFSALLAMHTVDGFKLGHSGPHTPRVTVDNLVVARETWRSTVDVPGLVEVRDERAGYLAVRGWRRELGLPDHVFVKFHAETKPVYFDLTSPVYASLLCVMARAALEAGDGAMTVTEVLPVRHWLTDAAGHRYTSELRMHVVDPEVCR
ncbi:lantibiotic dehydratase [Actinocrispum wychmicini]|uniref:Lantibiotic biosynthesis dehydratase-like protein n=1 Tax=Actinocrispum wychmicini TaxID=1213861 RepID=A0A4R2IMV8_9PSEU|nr:lantibiotic dehydratase [Actinocrispum wychmicini]TCO45318.1 lantibiotic biosynthesis dehydratase-like protein [Actinocrispum wychmicini]